MGWGLRLDIRSGIQGEGTPDVTVPGGTLVLERLGGGATQAKRGAQLTAELIFHAAYMKTARKVSEPDYQKFASLNGQLVLDESTGRPVFFCDPEAEIVHIEPEPDEDEPVRHLQLSFDKSTFRDPPPKGSAGSRLRLPAEPIGSRFFELGVELKVGARSRRSVNRTDDSMCRSVPSTNSRA